MFSYGATFIRPVTSCGLSYALILLLCAPFSVASVVRNSQPAGSARPSQASSRRASEVLVKFSSAASRQDRDIVVASHGTRRKKDLRGESGVEKLEVLSGQDPQTVAVQLLLNPAVEFAEPNFLIAKDQVVPGDPSFGEQWALRNTGQSGGQFGSDIKATKAWQTTTGARSTVIAVIDSGIDFGHPDLANNQWSNPAPGDDGDLYGWDYITDTPTISDEHGHGTAIAGILAAQGNNSTGISGVMWQASLMSLRVLDNTGTGDIANAVEAIDYAVSHGAQVINMSWGTSGESLALKEAIERAIRRGVVVVCSAGNSGQNVDDIPYYPTSFNLPDLISVAATDNSDQLAEWSNWGRRNVTVAAPGTNILTTKRGGDYWNVSGTSASAPFVAGVAGLIKSFRPWLHPRQVVNAIEKEARQVVSLSGKISELVNIVQVFIDAAQSEREFFDMLARTFTSANNSSLNEMLNNSGGPVIPREGRKALSDNGIKPSLRIPSTDTFSYVRHFVGGLIAAGRHGLVGLAFFADQDEGNPDEDSRIDRAINEVSFDLGISYFGPTTGSLDRARRSLADDIRMRFCE